MVGGDPGQHLGVEPTGVGLCQFAERCAKRLLAVAAGEIAMNLGQVVPLLNVCGETAFPSGRLAQSHYVRPPLLPLKQRRTDADFALARLELWGDRRDVRDNLGGIFGSHAAGGRTPDREQQTDRHKCPHQPRWQKEMRPSRAGPDKATRRWGDDAH